MLLGFNPSCVRSFARTESTGRIQRRRLLGTAAAALHTVPTPTRRMQESPRGIAPGLWDEPVESGTAKVCLDCSSEDTWALVGAIARAPAARRQTHAMPGGRCRGWAALFRDREHGIPCYPSRAPCGCRHEAPPVRLPASRAGWVVAKQAAPAGARITQQEAPPSRRSQSPNCRGRQRQRRRCRHS